MSDASKSSVGKLETEAQLKELMRKREELDRQIQSFKEKEKDEALAKVKELIETYSLSKGEVFGGKKTAKVGTNTTKPKYRNTETGATWSGRGKEPAWVRGKRDQFRIPE